MPLRPGAPGGSSRGRVLDADTPLDTQGIRDGAIITLQRSHRRRRRTHLFAIAVSVAAAGLVSAPAASAGTYDVHSCHLPDGRAAAVDGWSPTTNGSFVFAVADCSPEGGSLFASLANAADHPGGAFARWQFSAPADTAIVGFEADRRVVAGASAPFSDPTYILFGGESTVLEICRQFNGCAGLDGIARFEINGASSVRFEASCNGDAGCARRSEPKIDVAFRRTRVSLRDDIAPQISAVGGSLAVDNVVSGTASMSYNATDSGGGVYRNQVFVDDQLASDTVVDDNAGRCAEPFTHAVPCKLATAASASLDTTRYADGQVITVRVESIDAAGNRAIALAPRRVLVDNLPPCLRSAARESGLFLGGVPCNPQLRKGSTEVNGQGATAGAELTSWFARQVPTRCARQRDRRAGRRCVRTVSTNLTRVDASTKTLVRGQLLNAAGQPIAGAQVWMAKAVEGAAARMIGPITTRPDGRFETRLADRQPSGTIKLYYFPVLGSNDQVAAGDLRLRVRAGVNLTARRQTSRSVAFRGSVLPPSGANGVAVALQVFDRGRWRTFRQVRARGAARANFAATYRFPSRPAARRYRFRAVVLRQSGLPYDSGRSPARTVRLRR